MLPVVREVERELLTDPGHNHEYLPALGHPPACEAAIRLLLGEESQEVAAGRAFAVQSLGGTGPIRVGAEFLRDQLGCGAVRFSQPTWTNHRDIFIRAGYTDVAPYPYWDSNTKTIDFPALLACLESSQPRTVFILHAQVVRREERRGERRRDNNCVLPRLTTPPVPTPPPSSGSRSAPSSRGSNSSLSSTAPTRAGPRGTWRRTPGR